MIKLSNEKFLIKTDTIYIYKNKKLHLETRKEFKSMKDVGLIQGNVFVLNENEIVINHKIFFTFFGDKYVVAFYDLEKDKKIESFNVKYQYNLINGFCLLNKEILIYVDETKLYPVLLKNHSKMKEYKMENGGYIYSIISLNENHFIAAQRYYIHQFEMKNKKIQLINSIKLDNYAIAKYPKNKLIFRKDGDDNIIDLYGYYD